MIQLKHKKNIIIFLVILFVLLIAFMFVKKDTDNVQGILDEIAQYKGFTRVISTQEYEFYKYFVERELSADVTEEELDALVKAYTEEVNATFYLANRLGLREPYSFSVLQMRMEQENETRKLKLEQGETVYGLQQFDLNTFFQYEYSNAALDIKQCLLERNDAQIHKQAKAYYEANIESFTIKDQITYEITINGETSETTADRTQRQFLGDADPLLADFLENAVCGDVYEDVQNGEQRKIIVTDISYEEVSFRENEMAVVENYIEEELFPQLIEMIAANNPAEYN